MKKFALVFAAIASLSGVAAHADPIQHANNQVSVQLGSHSLDYREIDNYGRTGTDTLNTEKGRHTSMGLTAVSQGTQFGVSDVYLSARVNYWKGSTDYNGYLQSMTDAGASLIPFQNTTDNATLDVGLKAGRTFHLNDLVKGAALTPYAAYGYRSWERDLTGPYGYVETYNHHTVGAGVLAQYAATDKLVLSADLTVAKMLSAKMKTSDYGDFELQRRSQTTVALGVDYAVTPKVHLSAGMSLSKFKYGESAVNNGMLEPDSKTTERSYLVGVGYSF